MNKKVIIVVAIIILCIGIAICGFVIAKNNNADNDASYNQPVTNESVNSETTNFTQSPNIVFETSVHTEEVSGNNVDNNEETSADNRIYADDEDGVFNGGYFQWQ